MEQQQFEALVHRMERLAQSAPRAYRWRIYALAGFGYVSLLLIVLILLAVLAALLVAGAHHATVIAVKGGLIVGALLLVVLRALWVRLQAPGGERLTRGEAPQFFALLDRLKARLDTPAVHQVLVTDEFNAAVTQVPRLGVFGWHRNYLLLGLPLLRSLSVVQLEAVLAHELGHHVHRHILKGIAIQAAVTLVGFAAANWALHYAVERWHAFDTLHDFANLPLLILIFVVLSFLLMPGLNAFSRYNERQADRYAFENIGGVSPFISAMNKLAEQNLAERTPSRWVEWWFHSHPAIARRIAAAENWAKANP